MSNKDKNWRKELISIMQRSHRIWIAAAREEAREKISRVFLGVKATAPLLNNPEKSSEGSEPCQK